MNIEISGKVSSILAHKKASTVWSIGPNAMVFDAIQLMDEKNVGALPVVDNKTALVHSPCDFQAGKKFSFPQKKRIRVR